MAFLAGGTKKRLKQRSLDQLGGTRVQALFKSTRAAAAMPPSCTARVKPSDGDQEQRMGSFAGKGREGKGGGRLVWVCFMSCYVLVSKTRRKGGGVRVFLLLPFYILLSAYLDCRIANCWGEGGG